MSRALDHIVLPCRDLASAAHAFTDLGFTVGRRNRHPWGTENHIIQFEGAFLELIAMAADAHPPAREDDAFPFAGFLAGMGSSAEPSAMIVLRSDDAQADRRAFMQDGIGDGRMLHFARTAAAPDGGSRTVSFTLSFATAPSMPDLGFFVCQQHNPENFWDKDLQRHANAATGLRAVTLVAEVPEAHTAFLTRFTGRTAARGASGLSFACGNSRLDVLPPAAWTADTALPAASGRTRLADLRFTTEAGSAPHRAIVEGFPLLQIG